ncbi:MAG: flagellar biosynthetic protein FliO [Roseburia sp.]|nr:flagellar biosynthetic protein FliO [Roseburia sp.]
MGKANSYAQFITVLVVFVLVLGATALTTKWIAKYQKQQGVNGNIELLDAARLGNNKYLQIVRVGETYMVLAVCKDTVTMLGEVSAEQLREGPTQQKPDFKKLLELAAKKNPGAGDGLKEKDT